MKLAKKQLCIYLLSDCLSTFTLYGIFGGNNIIFMNPDKRKFIPSAAPYTSNKKIQIGWNCVHFFVSSRLLFFYSGNIARNVFSLAPIRFFTFTLIPHNKRTLLTTPRPYSSLFHSIREFYVSILWHNAIKSCWNDVISNRIKFEVIYYSKFWFDFHAGKIHFIQLNWGSFKLNRNLLVDYQNPHGFEDLEN